MQVLPFSTPHWGLSRATAYIHHEWHQHAFSCAFVQHWDDAQSCHKCALVDTEDRSCAGPGRDTHGRRVMLCLQRKACCIETKLAARQGRCDSALMPASDGQATDIPLSIQQQISGACWRRAAQLPDVNM